MLSTRRAPYMLAVSCRASRALSSKARLHAIGPPFAKGPSPPRLPREEQERYEHLQKSSTGAFSTPKSIAVDDVDSAPDAEIKPRRRPQINQSPAAGVDQLSSQQMPETTNARVTTKGDGEELHPDIRRGTKPEFEGERNPKTGETGGPKNEPLRWGGGVDWSYNGRVTDF